METLIELESFEIIINRMRMRTVPPRGDTLSSQSWRLNLEIGPMFMIYKWETGTFANVVNAKPDNY